MSLIKPTIQRLKSFIQRNVIEIIAINAILIVISPWLFTRNLGLIDFSSTGPIGDTIGGISSPFINILNSILIYLAFTEQKTSNSLLDDSNQLLRSEIKAKATEEEKRLESIKNLILWDLEHNIKKDCNSMIREIEKYLKDMKSNKVKLATDYVDFTDKIFQSNSLVDYYKIFNKDKEDLKSLINIYNRIKFIHNHTPYYLSREYPTDKTHDKFLNIRRHSINTIIIRHNQKKRMILEKLILNITNLVLKIDKIVEKYQPFHIDIWEITEDF